MKSVCDFMITAKSINMNFFFIFIVFLRTNFIQTSPLCSTIARFLDVKISFQGALNVLIAVILQDI